MVARCGTVVNVRPRWLSIGLMALSSALAMAFLVTIPGQAQQQQRRSGGVVLGYYVPYDAASWTSLEQHADTLDIVAAQWTTIDGCGNLGSQDDQTLKGFAREKGIKVVPSLLTLSGWLNHRLLTDDETSANAIDQIVRYTTDEDYDGFDLDLEAIDPADRPDLTRFVEELSVALHDRGKLLTLAIPAKERDVTVGWAGAYDYAALGENADLVTVMAYEFRGPFSGPGSVAPYDWVERVAGFSTRMIPPEKVLLGLAFYGYDWNTTSGGTRSIGYPQAVALADRYAAEASFDPAQQSVTFGYEAPSGEPLPTSPPRQRLTHLITAREPLPCLVEPPPATPTRTRKPVPPIPAGTLQTHEVWLEESASAAARLNVANAYQTGGIATWRLGLEDPNVWQLFDEWRRQGV